MGAFRKLLFIGHILAHYLRHQIARMVAELRMRPVDGDIVQALSGRHIVHRLRPVADSRRQRADGRIQLVFQHQLGQKARRHRHTPPHRLLQPSHLQQLERNRPDTARDFHARMLQLRQIRCRRRTVRTVAVYAPLRR